MHSGSAPANRRQEMAARRTELGTTPWCRHLSESSREVATHNGVIGAGIHESGGLVIVDGYRNIGGKYGVGISEWRGREISVVNVSCRRMFVRTMNSGPTPGGRCPQFS